MMHLITLTCKSLFCIVWIASDVKGRTFPSRTFRKEQKCNYLQNDGNQHNAYSHSALGDGFCCFCPRGTEWVDDCLPANPSSTQCKVCGPDYYIHFEPHLEPKCFEKRERHCRSPKVYYKGSEIEADGCICPDGMDEDKNTGGCMSAEPVMLGTTTISTTGIDLPTTHSDSPVSLTVATTTSTQTPKPVATEDSSAPATNGVTTNNDPLVGLPATKEKSKDPNDTQAITTSIIALLVAVCVILIFLWWSTRKTDAVNSSDPSGPTTKLSDDHSSSAETLEMDESPTSSMETLEVDISPPNESTRPPTNPEDASIYEEDATIYEESPLLDNRGAHQRCSRNEGFCDSENPNVSVASSTHSIRKVAEKILPEHYSRFAREVAKNLGAKCRWKHTLPIVRDIIENEDDNDLNDIIRNHEKNTRELIYQSMDLAIRYKGNDLTPLYILERVSRSGFRQYTEIVEREIEIFSKTQIDASKNAIVDAHSNILGEKVASLATE